MNAIEVLRAMIAEKRHRIATMPDPLKPALAQEWEELVIGIRVLENAIDRINAESCRVGRVA